MDVTADTVLPKLRDELQFLYAASDVGVDRGYLIFDPVQHKYFRIGSEFSYILANWHVGTAGKLIEAMKQRGTALALEQVKDLLRFVKGNKLTIAEAGGASDIILQGKSTKKFWLTRLLHHYLFFRIPLVHPHRFLTKNYPLVRWLGHRSTHLIIVGITLMGLYLTARQWDVFVHSFVNFTSWQGVVLLALALVVLKTAHELGHAFVATSYGCKVPVMGVAFLLLFPMLYSDVSDTWKLKNKIKRLKVDGAGMMVEVSMGGLSLFLWAVFPPGMLRDLCFFIATTGWLMSLLINLSPFMRFDGYHILADALGIHNLQDRGFAIGKWQMRKILLGLKDPVPEVFSVKMHRTLVAYAWGTWVYRFFLFLGIALLVYFMFFKLLGILLFVFEIMWFIIMPLYKESALWWARREEIFSNWRGRLSLGCLAAIVTALFLPLSQSVQIPAVVSTQNFIGVFAPIAARIDQVFVREGQWVNKGDILITLKWDDYNHLLRQAELKKSLVIRQIEQGVFDAENRALRPVLLREAKTIQRKIAGLKRQNKNLVLKASFDGVVRDVMDGLRKDLWVDQQQSLMSIVAGASNRRIHAMIVETQVSRLRLGATGVFVFEKPQENPINVQLKTISPSAGTGRELLYLSSLNHGPIEMAATSQGEGVPAQTHYRVMFVGKRSGDTSQLPSIWQHEARGSVVVQAARESLAGRFFKHVASVLLREAGF